MSTMPTLKSIIGLFGLSMVHFASAATAPQAGSGWPSVINPEVLNGTGKGIDTGHPWGWDPDKYKSPDKVPTGLPWWQWHPPAVKEAFGPSWDQQWWQNKQRSSQPSPGPSSTKKGSDQKSSDQQQPGQQQNWQQQNGQPQNGQPQSGQRQPGQQNGQQPNGQQPNGKQQPGQQQPWNQQPGNQQPGQKQAGQPPQDKGPKLLKRATVHCNSKNRGWYREDTRSRITTCKDGLLELSRGFPTLLIANHVPGMAICHLRRPFEPADSHEIPIVMTNGTDLALATFADMRQGVQEILDTCHDEPLAAHAVLYDNMDYSVDPPRRWYFEIHVGAF